MKSIDIILPLLGILYVLSPIDLLPEFVIPVLGVMDDRQYCHLPFLSLSKRLTNFYCGKPSKNTAVPKSLMLKS